MGEKSKSTLHEDFEAPFHTAVCTIGNTGADVILTTPVVRGVLEAEIREWQRVWEGH
jgi:hypothetical protein